jgi:hypothetical protein
MTGELRTKGGAGFPVDAKGQINSDIRRVEVHLPSGNTKRRDHLDIAHHLAGGALERE